MFRSRKRRSARSAVEFLFQGVSVMPVKYEGLFRLYPSLAECEGRKESSLVALLRHKELKGRPTPLEFVRWDTSPDSEETIAEHLPAVRVGEEYAQYELNRAMREILGGTKNLSDFPFWGAVLPADYREQAEFVVRQYVREMRKTDDLRLALLGAQGEVVGYGLTAAVVFAGMKNLGLSAQDLSKVEKGFSRLKYAAPPEESPKGKGPFKPKGLWAALSRAAAMFA